MFKKRKKFMAILLVMAVLVSTHLTTGIGASQQNPTIEPVLYSQFLAERGFNLNIAPAAPATPAAPAANNAAPATPAAPTTPAAPAAPAAPTVRMTPGIQAALAQNPALAGTGATAPGGFTAGRGNGGFTPSTRVPHATLATSIRQHAAAPSTVRGWIVVPNTNINVPVNLSTVSNGHYLYRDWRGNNYAGRLNWRNWNTFPDTATYMDFRTSVGPTWAATSRNINVYGHNWTNLRAPWRIGNNPQDRMFAQLKSYKNLDWAVANPHIYFSTPELEGVWRVFAVGYAHTTPMFFYNNPNPSRAQMQTIIDEWSARSHINFSTDVNADDRILTLTTCTRHHGEMLSQRFVVVARLLRPGESENDRITATRNANIRHPDFSQPTSMPRTAPPTTAAAAPAANAAPAAGAAPATPAAPAAGATPAAPAGPTPGMTPDEWAAQRAAQSGGTRLN